MTVASDRPWQDLPPAVAAAMRPELPALAAEIIAAIREGVPAYARPLDGPFGAGLRIGVEAALRRFVDEIGTERPPRRSDVYVNLGRGEVRSGRSLDVLLAAYRLGARVALRRCVEIGTASGLEPETLYQLAESIFAYIDELSAASAEGFALEQSRAAGAAQLRQRRLVALLLTDPPADAEAIEAAAVAAAWELPTALAALAVGGEQRDEVAARLPGYVAAGPAAPVGGAEGRDYVCILVPDPDAPGRRAELRRALTGAGPVGLGPTVSWAEAAVSFARAAGVTDLARAGALDVRGIVDAADHAPQMLIAADRRMAAELARRTLAPLDDLPLRSRERLTETLGAWLDEQGRLKAVADRLDVHPQTVRYRLGRLRDLLGDRLDDPAARFELMLALRARELADTLRLGLSSSG